MTGIQFKGRSLSSYKIHAMAPILHSQNPMPEVEFEESEDDIIFREKFNRCFPVGWKAGYYTHPEKPCPCPFTDADERRYFNEGVLAGADAREEIQPWPENKEEKSAEIAAA